MFCDLVVGSCSVNSLVNADAVVLRPEGIEFSLQVCRVPEKQMVEIFAADCSDQTFDEWMGDGDVWDSADGIDLENAQVWQSIA